MDGLQALATERSIRLLKQQNGTPITRPQHLSH